MGAGVSRRVRYTLAICRTFAVARAAFEAAIAEKPDSLMIRSRTRMVKRHPDGDW